MMARSHEESGRRGCWKGCALGCAGVVLVGLALIIGGPMLMMRPFRQAVDARQELEQRFGGQDAFVPAPDGAVPAERIEAFLAVRDELSGACSTITASSMQMKSMERFDGQEEVAKGVVMREAFRTVRSAFGLAPAMANLFKSRNRALLDVGMGLGEYTYIYVTAYHELLGQESELAEILGGEAVTSRVNDALTEIAQSQRAALIEAHPDHPLIPMLDLEIEALESDSGRVLWQDELPGWIALSFEPFRARLDESFCPAITSLDLSINESHGVAIETR
jgi:hypothetical protein